MPVVMDFSPLGDLGKTFWQARKDAEDQRQKQDIRTTLASLGQGNSDYDTIGRKLLSLGELSGGLGFMKLAQDEKAKNAQAEASRGFSSSIGSIFGGGASSAPTYGTTSGTPRANIDNGVHVAETEDDVQRLERATGMNTSPDLDKVVRTVYGEAGNQGLMGQIAVANVIRNRALQSGMTPSDIVMARGQFEPWADPAARARMEGLDPNSPEYQRIAAIVAPVLAGKAADPTGGADHFYAPKAQAALGRAAPAWDNGTGRDIGDHRFFKLGYGPQGKVQVAQADLPAPGAQQADFVIPGQGGQTQATQASATPQSRLVQALPQLIAAASDPNLPEAQRTMANTLLTQALSESKLSDTEKKYLRAKAEGFTGTMMDYELALKKAGATVVDASQKGDNKFEDTLGAKQADRWNGYIEQADKARRSLSDVNNLRELSARIGSQGSTAETKAILGPFAESLGIQIDGLSDIQAFKSVIERLAPQQRQPGSGSQSDIEYKGFLRSLPGLTDNPVARSAIMDTMEAMLRDDVARGDIATKLATKEIDRKQAEIALRQLPDPMSAFREFRKANPDVFAQALKSASTTGGAGQPNPQKPAAPPKIGDVQQGYRFKGGDPANQSSWEKMQ